MAALFISYRRADSLAWCNSLARHLDLRFGTDLVFRDLDDLEPGVRWRREIDAALRGAEVVLVVIGPRWLSPRQRRRLADPEDVLRQEIEMALRGRRRKVIPLLVGGAALPDPGRLPKTLRPLTDWQTCELRDRAWRRDVERLVERIRELMPALSAQATAAIYARLDAEQERYFAVLGSDPTQALAIARGTLRQLDRLSPRHPQDSNLQMTRGYTFKNIAQALVPLGNLNDADAALAQGERTFRTMLAERPRDAGAWNGLGSVEAVRAEVRLAQGRAATLACSHLRRAAKHVDKALSILPDYAFALGDRAEIARRLTELSRSPRGDRRAADPQKGPRARSGRDSS